MPPDRADIGEGDVTAAVESLGDAAFRSRYVRTDCQADDPRWTTDTGQAIDEYVRDQMEVFRNDVAVLPLRDFHGASFLRLVGMTKLIRAGNVQFEAAVPQPRDLLHVYAPDRDDTKDWTRFYRYAWTDEGPNAIIQSTDVEVVRSGRLACNSYAYSGQSSFALVGAGMFFIPRYGNARISIRPYVRWQTSASFTGNDPAPASATALLGIYVESWNANTGQLYYVDRDQWITVFSQNTTSYAVDVGAGDTATVSDGLATDLVASEGRKYRIFVYAYVETAAGPAQIRNELRFVTIDIDATVPFVVVEETL